MEENSNSETDIVYVNGFYINMKASDLQVNLYLNGEEVTLAIMSFITAKNFASKLTKELERYESALNLKIEDYDDVQARIDAFNVEVKKHKEDNKEEIV